MKLDKSAYQLLRDGAIALAQVESNGIRIDMDYLDNAISHLAGKVSKAEEKLKSSKVFRTWKKRYGNRTKITAKEQLATVLFQDLGLEGAQYHEPTTIMQQKGIETGNLKTDKTIFRSVDHPFVRCWEGMIQARDMRSRMIGLQREVVDGLFHPNFNLHIASTFRSSSGKDREDDKVEREFNFQNIPTRDEGKAELIRSAFVSRGEKWRIGEFDQKILEVRIGACYHKDPTMIKYINDPKSDMHEDAAMDCWMLRREQVSSPIRSCTKNAFVFAEFYGDWYKHCAMYLWKWMEELDLKLVNGTPLRKHLESKGIRGLGKCDPNEEAKKGTFELHIRKAEEDLWQRRFPKYNQWRKDWFAKYVERGWFNTLTGFRIEGVYNRKEVNNYPIQGSAFHCLLWAIIQLVKWLLKNKMKTKIVGQIHDSIVADIYEPEREDFTVKVREVMTEDVRKHWDWIIVPLQIEVQLAPLGGSWWEKEKQ